VDIPQKQNKMLESEDVANKDVQPTYSRAASVLENDYFYPEANGYRAITIRAATREDAHAIYLAKRKPVSPVERSAESEPNNE
jgi:DNA-binding GntR family transcriptional regulator